MPKLKTIKVKNIKKRERGNELGYEMRIEGDVFPGLLLRGLQRKGSMADMPQEW
jgi:hypothetical protein